MDIHQCRRSDGALPSPPTLGGLFYARRHPLDKDKLQTVSTFLVTVALLLFAYLLVQEAIDLARTSERISPETLVTGIFALANIIVVAAVARWLQQGAQHSAERAAEKFQEAVSSATTSGTITDTMEVDANKVNVNETR